MKSNMYNISKVLLLTLAILFTTSCTKDNIEPAPKSETSVNNSNENTEENTDSNVNQESNVSFAYEKSLQEHQGIVRRYKFTSDNKLIPSKEFTVPSFATEYVTSDNEKKLVKLIEKLLATHALPYVKYAYLHVGRADGENGASGFIGYMKDDLKEMYISISIVDYVQDLKNGQGEKETIHTIIHEYGHTLAENISQITPSNTGECNGTVTNADTNGCAKENAYINLFYNKFWKPILTEYDADPAKYVEEHKDDFVTGYAASNYGEDIAESITFFVQEIKPTGDTIKDKKVAFFYDYPELVAMRTEMRKHLN